MFLIKQYNKMNATIKYKNFAKLTLNDYEQIGDKSILGTIVFKESELLNPSNPIGVIIQTHKNKEFRTDMWGNSCYIEMVNGIEYGECRNATLSEIMEYRPELLNIK